MAMTGFEGLSVPCGADSVWGASVVPFMILVAIGISQNFLVKMYEYPLAYRDYEVLAG